MKITKNRYLATFTSIVALLALVRIIFPKVAENEQINNINKTDSLPKINGNRPILNQAKDDVFGQNSQIFPSKLCFFNADGTLRKNRIYSVPRFSTAFPDSNSVQLEAANLYGVSPVENRHDAESRKKELVYIGASPYFHVDRLRSSIPYLVPRAAVLLNDIGRTFYDSLQIKGVPLHQLIVTSVLRSREDIKKLRNYNGNATQNSCHLYGTTFDICYNRYKTVQDPEGMNLRKVRNDTLKWVLSEVLRDMRENNRCYIKYEVHQGCFHITVR